MSEDLFGTEVEDKPAATKPKTTNNMDTVQTVIERACSERPYMLIGPTGQPHRMGDNKVVKPLIFWEAEALHQLISQKLLTVGGNHTYDTRYGPKNGQAVLVPRKTRDMLNRWQALKPLHSNGNANRRSA
ncbi:hypothetical protein [Kutzneria chonburiensis]|uniref:Uncharacterized protein n=1 Tax=Kutzneria chonburiensis TaxID=1483604 RepID=A0ABV6MHU7_9PSEU|nr:hypothetical protein [Kutzneria chonburiensis]